MKTIVRTFAICLVLAAASASAEQRDTPDRSSNDDVQLEETITLSEVTRGALLLQTVVPGRYVEAPVVTTQIDVRVTGVLTRTSVRQSFRNPTSDCVDGIYVFPLPETSAVDRMIMRVGVRTIEGEIHERKEARQIFEQARSEGRKASLLEQERPDVFKLSVSSLGAGETVEITIEYDDVVRYDAGFFRMRLPLVVAPRYDPDPSRGAPDHPRTLAADPSAPRVDVHVDLDAGASLDSIESSSHRIDVVRTGASTASVEITDTPADRDLHLAWNVMTGRLPRSVVFTGSDSNDPRAVSYSMVMMIPPSQLAPQPLTSREQIFVIDTSGSMEGPSMSQAIDALIKALGRLRERDRFNVIEFDSGFRKFAPRSLAADPRSIESARDWVSSLRADGGTNILPALVEALDDDNLFPDELRQVIFITDGLVGNEDEIATWVRAHLGRSRLFTVGIGSAPNGHFMTSIARHGRGTYTWIPDTNRVEQGMSELLEKIETPALTGIRIEVADPSAEMFPRRAPDLYLGEPMIAVIRHLDSGATIQAAGQRAGRSWKSSANERHEAPAGVLGRLWARRKIDDISDQKLDGLPEDAARSQIISVALEHHLVSAHTSLVAVDQTPNVSSERCVPVPIPLNVPAGMDMLNGMLPRTGSDGPMLRLVAMLLLMAAAAVGSAGWLGARG